MVWGWVIVGEQPRMKFELYGYLIMSVMTRLQHVPQCL
jgi:hypothetical protein